MIHFRFIAVETNIFLLIFFLRAYVFDCVSHNTIQPRLIVTVHSQSMKHLSMDWIPLTHHCLLILWLCCTRISKIDYTAKFPSENDFRRTLFLRLVNVIARANKREQEKEIIVCCKLLYREIDETGQSLSEHFLRMLFFGHLNCTCLGVFAISFDFSAIFLLIELNAFACTFDVLF